jgi:hypothetical protein
LDKRGKSLGIRKRKVAKNFVVVWTGRKGGVDDSPSGHTDDSVGTGAGVAQEVLTTERHLQKSRTSYLSHKLKRGRRSWWFSTSRFSTNFVSLQPCGNAFRNVANDAIARLAFVALGQKSLAIARGATAASDLGKRSTKLQLGQLACNQRAVSEHLQNGRRFEMKRRKTIDKMSTNHVTKQKSIQKEIINIPGGWPSTLGKWIPENKIFPVPAARMGEITNVDTRRRSYRLLKIKNAMRERINKHIELIQIIVIIVQGKSRSINCTKSS